MLAGDRACAIRDGAALDRRRGSWPAVGERRRLWKASDRRRVALARRHRRGDRGGRGVVEERERPKPGCGAAHCLREVEFGHSEHVFANLVGALDVPPPRPVDLALQSQVWRHGLQAIVQSLMWVVLSQPLRSPLGRLWAGPSDPWLRPRDNTCALLEGRDRQVPPDCPGDGPRAAGPAVAPLAIRHDERPGRTVARAPRPPVGAPRCVSPLVFGQQRQAQVVRHQICGVGRVGFRRLWPAHKAYPRVEAPTRSGARLATAHPFRRASKHERADDLDLRVAVSPCRWGRVRPFAPSPPRLAAVARLAGRGRARRSISRFPARGTRPATPCHRPTPVSGSALPIALVARRPVREGSPVPPDGSGPRGAGERRLERPESVTLV